MRYCFGIDIGGTTVKMGLFQTDGTLQEKQEIPTRLGQQGEKILPDIAAAMTAMLDKLHINKADVAGVGMGIPAPVDTEGVVQKAVNLGWGYKAVKQEMEALCGFPVAAANDADVAALGEMWQGAGHGEANLVMVTLGTGVGGGIVVDGRPLLGHGGAAGEIGHLCVNPDETECCNCGKKGCLEQYASATGMVRIARQRLAEDAAPSVLRGQDFDAKVIWDAVKEGDALAMEMAETFGRYLGSALAQIAAVVDPALFVIGGGMSKAGPVLLTYVEKYYRENAFFSNREAAFTLASLGNDAGIIGAAKLVIE